MKKNPPEKRTPHHRQNRSGFTLLEVMMVVIILGILIALGVSGIRIEDNTNRAKIVHTKAAIAEIRGSILMYEADHSKYPATLESLVSAKLMHKIKKDGWGKALEYNSSTGEIWSDGGRSGEKISSFDL